VPGARATGQPVSEVRDFSRDLAAPVVQSATRFSGSDPGRPRTVPPNSAASHGQSPEAVFGDGSTPPAESPAACLSGVSPREGNGMAVSNNPLRDSRFRTLAESVLSILNTGCSAIRNCYCKLLYINALWLLRLDSNQQPSG
jgi:hypothetical protein